MRSRLVSLGQLRSTVILAAIISMVASGMVAAGDGAPAYRWVRSSAESSARSTCDEPCAVDDDDDDDDSDDDDAGIAAHDVLAPNRVWQTAIGLDAIRGRYDGEGVTVAVIDTGVSRVADLDDRVSARVDLTPDGDGYDRYGHGTHMIGLVAGDGEASAGRWTGVAPGADVVSVKVAGWDGATDVSVVIAAIQWVVSHREEYGIRVLSLSFGTDASQSYRVDPLDHAVERAWAAGILVVTSAGNRGPEGALSKPAGHPRVLTVGASDVSGTMRVADDTVASFSSRGSTADGVAKPDLVAPGITLVSSQAPLSTIDTFRPEARIDGAYFKGTGTSQAAAVVSGVAALLFQADPTLSPDEARAMLMGTTRGLRGQPGAGAGQVNAAAAIAAVEGGSFREDPAGPSGEMGTGAGSIDASRGSHRVFLDSDGDGRPERVNGEMDALGDSFNGVIRAATPWIPETWALTPWASVMCIAEGWADSSCGPESWSGMALDAQWWGHRTWSEAGWDQKSWTQKSWTQKSWTSGYWN